MWSVSIANLEAQEKAGIYSFLARVLSCRPTTDTMWGLCQMASAFGFERTDELSLDELDQEYAALFVDPNPRYVAPYESVFCQSRETSPESVDAQYMNRTSEGVALSQLAEDVQKLYQEAGLAPGKEVPDHIGSELRFMAYLWWRQSNAPEAEAAKLAEIRERFRRNHLLGWVGRLREKVGESDRLGYYRSAFLVAEAIIQDDI